MKSNKEWVRHIIKKFGKKDAYKWANQYTYFCPCATLNYDCNSCKFDMGFAHEYKTGCRESVQYFKEVIHNVIRVNEIKRIIIKKTRWWNKK